MKRIIIISLKLSSLALIIIAAVMWAGAGVDTRPKYRDEQTLVGGTIWSQFIIPFGLLLSMLVGEPIDHSTQWYFQITSILICFTTGFIMIFGEYKAMARRRRIEIQQASQSSPDTVQILLHYDKVYFNIGILSLLVGILNFAQFLVYNCY